MRMLRLMLGNNSGASAAEYAIILAIVGTGIIVAALTLGNSIGSSMNNASETIRNCGGGC